MGALLGYARVSTGEQDLALQHDALAAAGCLRVFSDTASGALDERIELARLLDHLREGDTLVVWRLDRLGRSLRHLIDTVSGLAERGVGFRSLQESIDTTTPGGRLIFHVFAALVEFERDLIRERTNAGLVAARARGRVGGRPPAMTPEKLAVARAMYASPTPSDVYVSATIPTALGGDAQYEATFPAVTSPTGTLRVDATGTPWRLIDDNGLVVSSVMPTELGCTGPDALSELNLAPCGNLLNPLLLATSP